MSERKDLPTGWENVPLSIVCKQVQAIKRKELDPETEFLYLDIGGIDNKVNKITTHKQYQWKNAPSRAQQVIFQHDVLFSTVRTYLKNIALVESGLYNGQIASSGFTVIRADKEIVNHKFLFYLSLSHAFLEPLNALQTGTSYPAVRDNDVFAQIIPLPPLAEQHRIVAKIEELFSALDKGVESLKTAREQLKIYRQAVLKWAFEGKLTENNEIRYVSLGSLCESVEYGSAAKSQEAGDIPVLRMGNIQGGKFDWSDLVYTSDKEEIEKYSLHKNDVLFNRTNSPEWVGKTAIYRGERPAIFAGYLIRIHYKKDKIEPNYLNYFLNSQEAKNYGNRVKSFGVNQSNINGTKLKTYPFPYTEIAEQHRIVSEIERRLSVCDTIEASIEESLQKADALRQSILKKAFEGKLVPQDPADEPASVLLERVRSEKRAAASTGSATTATGKNTRRKNSMTVAKSSMAELVEATLFPENGTSTSSVRDEKKLSGD
jgi:type I restriction enzyme S subunit